MRERSTVEDGFIKIRPPKLSDVPILYNRVYSESHITIPAGLRPHGSLLNSYLVFLLNKLNLFLNYWCIINNNEICGVLQILEKRECYYLRIMLSEHYWGKAIGRRSVLLSTLALDISRKPLYAVINKNNIKQLRLLKSSGFYKVKETDDKIVYKLVD